MYIGMSKSKSSASSIPFPSIFLIHLINGAEFVNATGVGLLYAAVTISPLTKM